MRIFLSINNKLESKLDCHSEIFDSLREKCGIVAVWSNKFSKQLPLSLIVAGGVQHRGQQGAGFCAYTKDGLISHQGSGLLKDVFPDKTVEKLNKPSCWSMVHCRYGTCGDWEDENIQPCMVKDSYSCEKIVVIHNGQFADIDGLRNKLKGKYKDELSDTYLFAQLLAQTDGENWDERIKKVFIQVDGAFSLIIGIGDTLYFVRDKHGLRPFVMGHIKDGIVVASETHALDKVQAERMVEINPGAILKINNDGLKHLKKGSRTKNHFCDLERAYFSRPDSMWLDMHSLRGKISKKWISFSNFRYSCGKKMAEEVEIKNASFVVGVPDSGIAFANGFANASKIPYMQTIIRDHHDLHGSHRLFLGDENKSKIGNKVLGKLSIVQDADIWEGAVVVIGDDSLIRGNVSTQITKAVFDLGASEVHWVLGFPPVCHRCHLGVSMRTEDELIAAKYDSDEGLIAREIDATSVHYISKESFIRSYCPNGRFKFSEDPDDIFLVNGGCGGCLTGRYPV